MQVHETRVIRANFMSAESVAVLKLAMLYRKCHSALLRLPRVKSMLYPNARYESPSSPALWTFGEESLKTLLNTLICRDESINCLIVDSGTWGPYSGALDHVNAWEGRSVARKLSGTRQINFSAAVNVPTPPPTSCAVFPCLVAGKHGGCLKHSNSRIGCHFQAAIRRKSYHHPTAAKTYQIPASITLRFPRIISANMTDNTNNSTLGAAFNSATGAVQNAIGSLTGSTGDQVSMVSKL